MSKKFIITSESKPSKNYLGEVIGMQEKRALFYNTYIGRNRIYRFPLYNKNIGFKLRDYTCEIEAQVTCDEVNELYNDDFKVESYTG